MSIGLKYGQAYDSTQNGLNEDWGIGDDSCTNADRGGSLGTSIGAAG
jgi:hypothetical protein